MAPEARSLFVVGSPRSGTTLMAGVLNQLPGVWVGYETGFVPHLYRAGVESIHEWDDQRLAALLEEANSYLRMGHWSALATVAGVRQYWSDSGHLGYAGLIRYVWSLDHDPDDGDVVIPGDQTPTYVLAMPLLEQLFPEAMYVHVVRDPRDVVSSVLPQNFGAQSAAVAASDWNECVAGWWAAERRVPVERRCEVRYEDLVADPTATLERLATFLDLSAPEQGDWEPGRIDPHGLAEVAPHHERLAGPIDDRSVGRHLRDLSDRDRDLVESITYAGLVSYGYPVGPYRPSPVLREDASLLARERLRDLRRRAVGSVARRRPRWR